MVGEGMEMKRELLLAGLVAVAGAALALAQTSAPPKDPPLIDTQGYQRILEQYKGKPLLVNFWATWCEPCRDEYPMLNEFAKQYAQQGLKVVGISMDQDGDLILMRRFLARYKPVFPNYRKRKEERSQEEAFPQRVMEGWNGAMPASFFYAKDGTLVGHLIGGRDHDTYEAAIRMILSK
jgi:thiol-disulfide isomerase/thioredoxin